MFQMKKNRILALTGAACLSVALLAGCGNNGNNNTNPSANPSNDGEGGTTSTLSGKIATGGSTSMQKLMGMLQEDFMAKNAGVTISYDPTGSGAGITGASDGSLDIGLSSRVLHDDETDVEAITVCLDGIAVVVNNANGVEDLSLEQLAGIFSGEITNWSEVGGSDGEIVVIGREAGSGTRDGFEEIVGVKDNCKYAQELTATGAVTAAVAANENAIGYASLSAVDDSVKAVKVEGVDCTEETVQDGSYKVQRPFNFVVKKDAELSEAAQAFVEYVTSGDANQWILEAGCVPIV
ncbi:MAG: phosphate ABC transporter substrate-binding protein [Clostridiales bacterium]|nr:phosphate ABC transporter substrate-binding protein [bacterium 210917-SL.2.15]MCI5843555.1 phosphate ABC transporter substrate-binding protein [Clostridiales bacterium]MDY4037316.1 phosphate ABC transporter substrate-binding protein [Candidatus Pseudoscilispira sp.]